MRTEVDETLQDAIDIEICCAPVLAAPMSADEAAQLSKLFKVLAEPARLQLLSLVATAPQGMCGCDLTEPVGRSQGTVSHHLNDLVDAGLLTKERRGKWVWYHAVPERLAALAATLLPPPRSSARDDCCGPER